MGYLIFLRLIHIVGGIFWAGATLYLAGFIIPAVKALGPDGGKFMQQLSKTNKLPLVMNLSSTLTVLGGVLLVWELSGGFRADWFGSSYGMVLSTGGTLAIIAYAIGFSVSLPTILKMNKVGGEIAASGGPPTPAQLSELGALRNKLFKATRIIAVLLFIAIVCMSIARYCNF